MLTQRQYVLYGLGVLALAGVVLFFALKGTGGEETPETPVVVETGSRFEPIATTSTVRAEPVRPDAPAQQPFRFEIVSDQKLQAKGLSGRAEIPQNYGMLFVFAKKEKHGFWMKDMLAAIDIIWISDERVILKVDEDVSPATYPTVFDPPEPVRYVLETRAGEARRLGLTPGTKVNLPLP